MIVPYHIFEDLGISKHLARDFFVAFARFEYALKATGYVNGGEAYAQPNWDLWASDSNRGGTLAALLRNPITEQDQRARAAFDYISNAPPKKQKWDATNKQLYWDPSYPLQGGTELQKMVDALKRVRNNLFHGGKFLTPDSSHESAATRNRTLVVHGLALLEAMLSLDTDLSFVFYH